MTDLAELKRARAIAEGLDGYIAMKYPRLGAMRDDILPDAKACILSLIQRVETAEASKERTNYYHAIEPPKTTDPNGLAAWLSWNEASSIGSMAGVLSDIIEGARKEGRTAGVEEAVEAETEKDAPHD